MQAVLLVCLLLAYCVCAQQCDLMEVLSTGVTYSATDNSYTGRLALNPFDTTQLQATQKFPECSITISGTFGFEDSGDFNETVTECVISSGSCPQMTCPSNGTVLVGKFAFNNGCNAGTLIFADQALLWQSSAISHVLSAASLVLAGSFVALQLLI